MTTLYKLTWRRMWEARANSDDKATIKHMSQDTDALRELLREVAENGLIYWQPVTTRGHQAKADMLARIDAALSTAPAPERRDVASDTYIATCPVCDATFATPGRNKPPGSFCPDCLARKLAAPGILNWELRP